MNTSNAIEDCVAIRNLTSPSDADVALQELTWSDTDKLLVTIILPTVVLIGVVANLCFLVTVARIRRMRTVTNFYLSNLAVADMLFLAISMGTQLYTYKHSTFEGNIPATSVFSCWGSIFPVILTYFASVALVTLVALERYYAICKPVKHRINQGKNTFKIICTAWAVSTALALLSTPRFGKLQTDCLIWPDQVEYLQSPTVYHECVMINIYLGMVSEIVRFLVFIIAMIITCASYFKVITHLNKRSKKISGRYSRRNQEIRNQVARIVVINAVVFFVFQFPSRYLNVDRFVHILTGTLDPSYGTIYSISFGILLLNSVVNPFIYGLGSQLYREAFCEAFGILKCLNMDDPQSTFSEGNTIDKPNGSIHGHFGDVENEEGDEQNTFTVGTPTSNINANTHGYNDDREVEHDTKL